MNEAFSRNARRGRTYGRDRIYRIPVGSAGGPKMLYSGRICLEERLMILNPLQKLY